MRSIATLVALAGTAHAGLFEIENGLRDLTDLASNGTDDRKFTGFIEGFTNTINGYGCWCNFNEKYVNSKGPVQDDVDAECKILIHGYRCAIADATARGEECDIVTEDYTPYNFFSSVTDLVTDCAAALANVGNQCKIDLCIIEGRFTLVFFSTFFSGGIPFDPTYHHPDGVINQGTFDPATECVSTPSGKGKSDLGCCGKFETNRYQFRLDDGASGRLCCEAAETVFDVATQECCATSVALQGGC